MRATPKLAAGLLLGLLLTSATPTGAQTVRGTVVDDESGVPLGTVEVAVLDTDERVVFRYVTDENGRFVARMPDAGSYRLFATRIGYQSTTSNVFVLDEGQAVLAELRLQLSPVLLDPLEAIVEGQSLALARVGFYQREQMGFAQVRTPEDIEAKPPLDLVDLFQGMSGILIENNDIFSTRTNIASRSCRPSISINGMVVQVGHRTGSSLRVRPLDGLERWVAQGGRMNLPVGGRDMELQSGWGAHYNVNEVAAIEVVAGAGGLPDWASGSISPCGAVLIWTKGYVAR